MSDLPPDSAGGFEIRSRLNDEMEYFKEMALQETEKWIELVTKKRFKYPENPRRSLQDGILLCELVNALKPGAVRKINRLPTPIAFLDNLTVFQNACRCEFGMQDSQLFDIKDLEDLSLRGVLESEEEIFVETSRRLKNVAITIFWLGKSVRRWYKGPMLDFAAFTDIIDMSHSSQASFRTPSEASYVSSSTGRFSTDRYSSSKGGSKQSDMAYERVAKYLESKPVYGYQTSYESVQEPVSRSASQKGEVFPRPGSDFEDEYFGGSIDSGDMYRPAKSSPKPSVPLPPMKHVDVPSRGSATFQTRTNGTLEGHPKTQQLDSGRADPSRELNVSPRSSEGPSSPREGFVDRQGRGRLSVGSPRADGVRSPVSPGTAVMPDPMQFVKGGSNALAENAKQTLHLLQQQQHQHQQHQGVRQVTREKEDDNWEAKLSDWKSRRRSQTKSQTTSETDDVTTDVNRVEVGRDIMPRQSSTAPHAPTEHTTEPTSPTKTVIKKREQEEDMLAVFGFTKIPEKPTRKPKAQRELSEEAAQRDSGELTQRKANEDREAAEREAERQRSDEWMREKHLPMQQTDAIGSAVMPGCEGSSRRSTAEVAADSREQKRRYLEKVIKISQRPQHHKGFGFSIKGGKEHGMPITVDKVNLGGAADVCDLMSKDEIFAINGAQLANHYLESVRAVIDQAVHCGQVELTIRRAISEKSFDESESDVFAEEDLVFDVDHSEDETDSKLMEMLELEKDRPVTPVPPEDEPPPLPAAPPPAPNWNTFPGSPNAFSPAGDIQYFDDAEPSHENLQQEEEVILSKAVPPTLAEKDGGHHETGLERSAATEVEEPVHRADPEKFDMLMKRIHFFGLKPEDSEEYRKAMEEKNGRQVKTSSTKSPSVQSDERMFAIVMKPCEATLPSSPRTPASETTTSSSDVSLPTSTSIPSSGPEIQDHIEQHNERVEEREVVRKVEIVETISRVEKEGKGFGTKPITPIIDRERFFAEYGKSDVGLKSGIKSFDSSEPKGEAATKLHDTFESGDQPPLSSKETSPADRTEPCSDASAAPQSPAFSDKKSTSNEERKNVDFRFHDNPKDEVGSDSKDRHSEDFPKPLETSKAWKSMEMLRSLSVSDATFVDPTERAKEDYLSLMMTRPKLSLERVNQQYFDRDSDLKRMEEWHKKQEELRKEKFDRDQEEIRLKHETALKEAAVLEREKQTQEEQLLEKEIIWKRQLDEIHQQRDTELAMKKQKEDREEKMLAAEKAERERHRERQIERERERERETEELERKTKEMFSFIEQSQSQLRQSGESPQKQSTVVEAVDNPDDIKIGKVEIQFIDSAPTQANLEILSDSINASSESLASSSQLEFNQGDGANGRNMEPIKERQKGAFSTNYSSAAGRSGRGGQPTRQWGGTLWKEEEPERGSGDTHSSSSSASDSKSVPREKVLPGVKPVPRDKVLPGVTVQRTKSEWNAEAERSAQLIRDEARFISRRAGGGSQWLDPDAEEYRQMSKPEPAICRTVPVDESSPEPRIQRSVPLNPSPAPLPSTYQFPQQPLQQQQPVTRRIVPMNLSPEPAIRQSTPLNPSPTSLPSSHPFPQQPHQQQQQPWNRKLLQDISAPPKHRLQDSESWITARQDDDEFEEEFRRSQVTDRQVAPVVSRATPGRPSVPVRTDSLKQTSPVPAALPSQNTGLSSLMSYGAREPTMASPGPSGVTGEVLTTNLWQVGYSNISSGSSQENVGGTAPTRWASSTAPLQPDSFNVPASSIRHGGMQPYGSQSRGTLDQPTGGSDPLVFPRYSEVGPTAGTPQPEVRLRSYELPLRSSSYNVPPQPSKSRPYSCDLSQFSRPAPALGAVPYQRSLHDPTPLEPTSEAVSMLFDYHRSPLPQDDIARLSLDISRSPGLKSPESSKTWTSDGGGQKCAGCDSDLGFGRCIVLDSLDFCFHPGCFKCSVCRCPLRNQSLRDEFRILASKLHCRNCYTNEQEGLKYSKV